MNPEDERMVGTLKEIMSPVEFARFERAMARAGDPNFVSPYAAEMERRRRRIPLWKRSLRVRGVSVCVEFKVADLWVGAFWKADGIPDYLAGRRQWHLWVCLLPCLPLHFTWWRPENDEA